MPAVNDNRTSGPVTDRDQRQIDQAYEQALDAARVLEAEAFDPQNVATGYLHATATLAREAREQLVLAGWLRDLADELDPHGP